MNTKKGFYIVEGCFNYFLSDEPDEGYCEHCGTRSMTLGYAATIEEAVLLLIKHHGYEGFEVEDEDDLGYFIELWEQVAKEWEKLGG